MMIPRKLSILLKDIVTIKQETTTKLEAEQECFELNAYILTMTMYYFNEDSQNFF